MEAIDPNGVVDMEVLHLFQATSTKFGKQPMFRLFAEIGGDTLKIEVKEGERFGIVREQGFMFTDVVAGAVAGDRVGQKNKNLKDTDSVQVAVRWCSATGKEIIRKTNAWQVGMKRDKGADWIIGGLPPNMWATWSTEVPNEATQLEVIIVYTDSLFNTPGMPDGADLPLVIGSFTGNRKDVKGPWTIRANRQDVFPPRAAQPGREEYAAILTDVQEKLKKTGYEMRTRPKGLSFEDTLEMNAKFIAAAIGKTINTKFDTGYDMFPLK